MQWRTRSGAIAFAAILTAALLLVRAWHLPHQGEPLAEALEPPIDLSELQ